MTLRATYHASQTNIDFFARNASGQWYNTDTPGFENYNSANLADYRITATETPSGSGLYEGTEPTGTTEYELRVRGATLADSYVVAGPAAIGDVDSAAVAATQAAAAATSAATAVSQTTAAATRAAIGLSSANIDTQLGGISAKTALLGTLRSLIRWG